MTKNPIVAGNWKMNKTPLETLTFINDIDKLVSNNGVVDIIISPPYTSLSNIESRLSVSIAAQNCHWEDAGAFTGEISVKMLKGCGVEYVITGHSERRHIFNESDEIVNKKFSAINSSGLKPILCVGETIDERKNGKTGSVLRNQLDNALIGIRNLENCFVAYEPVWAIGTGMTANMNQIEEAHLMITKIIREKIKITNHLYILYGGSVNSGNAADIIAVKNVDGFLIGGASLDAGSFASIIDIVEKNREKIQ